MTAPIIQAKVIDGERWMKVSDHVADIQRYKTAMSGKDTTIANQAATIINLQKQLISKMKDDPIGTAVDGMMDSLFGGKKK